MSNKFSLQKHILFYSSLYLWVLVFSLGCSHTFVVDSDPPGAQVFVATNDKGDKKVLGTTPLNMPMQEVRSSLGQEVAAGEYFTIGIEKPGFISEKFSVPAGASGTLVTNLKIKLKEGDLAQEERKAKEIIDRLFLAQRFALLKQFERAQIEIDKILTDFPNFSRAMTMRASIYFAQQDYKESLKWYEAAIKADPQAEEAVKLATRVREIMAGGPATRLPAGTNSGAPAPGAAPTQPGGQTP